MGSGTAPRAIASPQPSKLERSRGVLALEYERQLPRRGQTNKRKGKGKGPASGTAAADTIGSGNSWAEKVDVDIAKAILFSRHDAIAGTDQSLEELWDKNMADFSRHQDAADVDWATDGLSRSSLQHHWNLMSNGVHEFAKAFRCAQAAQPTVLCPRRI